MAFLADGELAEQALNRASPLDREHKRLGHLKGDMTAVGLSRQRSPTFISLVRWPMEIPFGPSTT